MDSKDALILLASSSPHQRLQAARFLARQNLPKLLPQLRTFLQKERVAHVKTAIELAITRNSASENIELQDEQLDPLPNNSHLLQKNDADKWAGILLHEIEPKVGLIRVSAQQEIKDYESSNTYRYLESLDRILTGFSDLRKSIATPRADEFDLCALIKDICEQEQQKDVAISFSGPMPFMVRSDKNLLLMAISNGIRNALEAIPPDQDDKFVVITWGRNDVENYVTILDSGPGLPEVTSSLFEVGNSSKKNHGGFGLAVVKHAMENLDGSANLYNSKFDGAKLELKWGF